jgi:Na+-transporting methylmalonyl-CoA/oxaloacetate decarboxylase gamma subunit
MEVLVKAQSLIVEHAFTIGIVLLVVVLLAGVVWFAMTRSVAKSPELENKARVNETTTAPSTVEQSLPTQEQLEEMARYRANMEAQQQAHGDNLTSE